MHIVGNLNHFFSKFNSRQKYESPMLVIGSVAIIRILEELELGNHQVFKLVVVVCLYPCFQSKSFRI
jgi:hypothetical protein